MAAKKRNSIVILVLFELIFTILLVTIYENIIFGEMSDRLDDLLIDTEILGEWIQESHRASGYLLESMVLLVPIDDVVYPPRDTKLYSDKREYVKDLGGTFPHTVLSGIIDESGILTHSLYHDGMDMKGYEFYGKLLSEPAGATYYSNAFEMDNGEFVVCHALKSPESDRRTIAVMMINLNYFEEFIDRIESEDNDRIMLIDRKGRPLAGSSETEWSELQELLSERTLDDEAFGEFRNDSGDFFLSYQIPDLPYTIVLEKPVTISLRESLLPLIIIMIGYLSIEALGVMVFSSHLRQLKMNRELEIYFDNSLIGIVMLREGRIVHRVNQRMVKLLKYESPGQMEGRSVEDFHISKENFLEFGRTFYDPLIHREMIQVEYPLKAADGSHVWFSISGKAVDSLDPPDLAKGVVWIFEDITERRAAQKQLEEMATTDFLTGIANRRFFIQSGERECANHTRHKTPLSVMMMDIDHFKAVNDRYGHDVGDRAIQRAVNICRETLRTGDLFGRVGGEEFAFVLPNTDIESAELAGERIRSAIEENAEDSETGVPAFTVSIGITEAGEETLEELLTRADVALYKAKKGGRNRVCRA